MTGARQQVVVSSALRQIIENAEREAERLQDQFVSTEHLLLAMVDPAVTSEAGRILREAGATRERLYEALVSIRGGEQVTDPNPEEKYQALEKYARDLTDAGRDLGKCNVSSGECLPARLSEVISSTEVSPLN